MKIIIETIPHKEQLYPTVGDWRWDDLGQLQIKVSDMGDWRYEFLVALHELVETMLCRQRDISPALVDEFDIAFEELREKLPEVIGDMEPGDMTSAPYYREHQFATRLEKQLAAELGVDWNNYNLTVEKL